MNTHLSIKKSYLSTTYTCKYSITAELNCGDLPILVDKFLNELSASIPNKKNQLINVKGRDPLALIDSKIPVNELPNQLELAFVSGTVLRSERTTEEGKTEFHNYEQPFYIRLNTPFLEFQGTHDICHSLTEDRHKTLPSFIPYNKIGVIFPATIKRFRFGIDLYKSRKYFSFLGFAPTVYGSLLVECTDNSLKIDVIDESLQKKTELPLQQYNLFSTISDIIKEVFNLDLNNDYQQCLENG